LEEGNGMVLDEDLENSNDPEKDEDTTSHFTEKFNDEETCADTEMEVSPSHPFQLKNSL
jgi:hypothetical protein